MLELDPTKAEYRVRPRQFQRDHGFSRKCADRHQRGYQGPSRRIPEFYWIKGIISMMAAGTDYRLPYLEEAIKAFGVAIARNGERAQISGVPWNADAQLKDVVMALNSTLDSAIALPPGQRRFRGSEDQDRKPVPRAAHLYSETAAQPRCPACEP